MMINTIIIHIAENRAPAHVPCSMSKFGCCADGITAARGKNRLGCPGKLGSVPADFENKDLIPAKNQDVKEIKIVIYGFLN